MKNTILMATTAMYALSLSAVSNQAYAAGTLTCNTLVIAKINNGTTTKKFTGATLLQNPDDKTLATLKAECKAACEKHAKTVAVQFPGAFCKGWNFTCGSATGSLQPSGSHLNLLSQLLISDANATTGCVSYSEEYPDPSTCSGSNR